MNLKTVIIVWTMFLTAASLCFAQTNSQKISISSSVKRSIKNSSSKAVSGQSLSLSSPLTFSKKFISSSSSLQKESWIISIRTGGGYLGQKRDISIINSEGDITLSKTGEYRVEKASTTELESLSQIVGFAKPGNWAEENLSLCMDCFVTTFTLSRYQPESKVKKYIFIWDDSTYAKIPDEIKQIYQYVLTLINNKNAAIQKSRIIPKIEK